MMKKGNRVELGGGPESEPWRRVSECRDGVGRGRWGDRTTASSSEDAIRDRDGDVDGD